MQVQVRVEHRHRGGLKKKSRNVIDCVLHSFMLSMYFAHLEEEDEFDPYQVPAKSKMKQFICIVP